MGRRVSDSPTKKEQAEMEVASTNSASQLRAAQAVLLPLLGYSLVDTATAVGRDRGWVSRTRNRYIAGETDFSTVAVRGGRRTSLLNEKQEDALILKAVRLAAGIPRREVRDVVRELLRSRLKRDPAESTITALMNRAAARIYPGLRGVHLQYVFLILDLLKAQESLRTLVGVNAV